MDEITGDFFQRLRGFYYVAKTGSVTKAAELMGRNQSTISVQIHKLESGLGISLFKRGKKHMQLTDAGFHLYSKTLNLFETIKEIRSDIGSDGNTLKGQVHIAASNQISAFYLPQYIVQFRKRHTEVCFSFFSDSHDGLVNNVDESESDFGIVANHGNFPPSMLYTELFESSLSLLMARGATGTVKNECSIQDIVKLPFVGFNTNFQLHKFTQRLFESAGAVYRPVIQVPSYELLIRYVAMGAGVSILDTFVFCMHGPEGVVAKELRDVLPKRQYGIIQRRNKYFSPQARAFMHFLNTSALLSGNPPKIV